MGLLSNKISREEIKPGDHIYSWRQFYIYAHHGIYVGEGKVIHFTRGADQEIVTGTVLNRFLWSSSPSHDPNNPCPQCGDNSRADGVILSCLDCFLSGGYLCRFEYGVSPALFLADPRGGTCTLARSDPPEDVLHRANALLLSGFGDYNVFKNNCEDFTTYCKTGLVITGKSVGRSGQANFLVAAANAVVSSPLRFLTASTPIRFLTTSFSGVPAIGCGMYCMSRFASDIGVRSDVAKIPVAWLVTNPGLDKASDAAEMAKDK